jgi:hypothetical protein
MADPCKSTDDAELKWLQIFFAPPKHLQSSRGLRRFEERCVVIVMCGA